MFHYSVKQAEHNEKSTCLIGQALILSYSLHSSGYSLEIASNFHLKSLHRTHLLAGTSNIPSLLPCLGIVDLFSLPGLFYLAAASCLGCSIGNSWAVSSAQDPRSQMRATPSAANAKYIYIYSLVFLYLHWLSIKEELERKLSQLCSRVPTGSIVGPLGYDECDGSIWKQ